MGNRLQKKLDAVPAFDYPKESRVHPLRSLPGCFVKRDDELGFGISGSKIRKYRTLLPYLLAQGCKEIAVIGGAHSNHVLSISQLLIENGIRPILYLKGPPPKIKQGNFFFLTLLASEIRWVEKEQWPSVHERASLHHFAIPEGAALFPSFLGALTLPLDILRNEEEGSFDRIFLDAGTGWSAAALLLGFAYLQKSTFCHVLLLAEPEEAFRRKLVSLHAAFQEWLGEPCPFPTHFDCLRPTIAPSFGSTNRALFDFLTETARLEGFFIDPIYSAKLFFEAKRLSPGLSGRSLLIHSGGALTLTGFQRQIEAPQVSDIQ